MPGDYKRYVYTGILVDHKKIDDAVHATEPLWLDKSVIMITLSINPFTHSSRWRGGVGVDGGVDDIFETNFLCDKT